MCILLQEAVAVDDAELLDTTPTPSPRQVSFRGWEQDTTVVMLEKKYECIHQHSRGIDFCPVASGEQESDKPEAQVKVSHSN